MSQIGSYLAFISLMLITSGATQPGVPHRTKRYQAAFENSAKPKSAITHSKLPSDLNRIFYGFRSLCMIFLLCISFKPFKIEQIATLTYAGLNLYLAFTLSYSCPPSRSSTTIQREFQDSKTSKSFMQFLWLRFLMTSIYLMRHSLPLSSLQAAYLENAFTAQFFPSSSFQAKQTEAKFPFPIFFLGLNSSWNPRWLILSFKMSLHCWRSLLDLKTQVHLLSFFQRVTEGGEVWKAYLTSKSKTRQALDLSEAQTRHFSQIAMVRSPSSSLLTWQVAKSWPRGLGAQLEKRDYDISIYLQSFQQSMFKSISSII